VGKQVRCFDCSLSGFFNKQLRTKTTHMIMNTLTLCIMVLLCYVVVL